jgi:hypothetical protein
MSMLKMVPEGLKPQECTQIKLRKPPPVPYVPVKDEVQDDVAKLQSLEIKTMIEKDTTLNLLVWQENGTREAFLMHVTALIILLRSVVIWTTTRRPCGRTKKPRKTLSPPGLV